VTTPRGTVETRKELAAAAGNGTIGTAVQLYAASGTARTDTVIKSIVVCNAGSTSATYTIAINTATATYEAGHYKVYQATIAANDTVNLDLGLIMDPVARYLNVSSSSANVNFSVYGSENTP
jgi:hypothetical protein